MQEVFETLYKECLGGKGALKAEDVGMFVGPFKGNPDSRQALRIETLMALKSYKGEKIVCYFSGACASYAKTCTARTAPAVTAIAAVYKARSGICRRSLVKSSTLSMNWAVVGRSGLPR